MKNTFTINYNFASLIDVQYAKDVLDTPYHSYAEKNNMFARLASGSPAFKALQESVDRLDIGVRTYHVLHRAGIRTIYDLLIIPNEQWWNFRGVGVNTMFDLKEALTQKELLPIRPSLLRLIK